MRELFDAELDIVGGGLRTGIETPVRCLGGRNCLGYPSSSPNPRRGLARSS
jgi:hypothetical protein